MTRLNELGDDEPLGADSAIRKLIRDFLRLTAEEAVEVVLDGSHRLREGLDWLLKENKLRAAQCDALAKALAAQPKNSVPEHGAAKTIVERSNLSFRARICNSLGWNTFDDDHVDAQG